MPESCTIVPICRHAVFHLALWNVFLEAMIQELPGIAFNCYSGSAEMITDNTGFSFRRIMNHAISIRLGRFWPPSGRPRPVFCQCNPCDESLNSGKNLSRRGSNYRRKNRNDQHEWIQKDFPDRRNALLSLFEADSAVCRYTSPKPLNPLRVFDYGFPVEKNSQECCRKLLDR